MDDRLVAVAGAAVVVVAAVGGCSQQQPTAPERVARVTVGGDTRTTHAIRCSQLQWFWTIDIGDEANGVEAAVQLNGDRATAKWVKIHNFGGFTGNSWEGRVGSADASLVDRTYMVAGTAYGVHTDNPSKPDSERFSIIADC